MRTLSTTLALGLTLLGARSGHAIVPADALTPELTTQAITITALRDGTLSYFGPDRRLTRQPATTFLRLTFPPPPEAPPEAPPESPQESPPEAHADPASVPHPDTTPPAWFIELTDGQRLVGEWTGSADKEAVGWRHPRLGDMDLPLDRIRRWGLKQETLSDAATPAAGDVVELRNGDQLVGFVLAVDGERVTFQPDGSDAEVQLPRDSLANVTLATLAEPAAAGADLVRLRDGSRVRATELTLGSDGLSLRPTLGGATQPVMLPLETVTELEFSLPGRRLLEGAELAWQETQESTPFGVPWPARRVDGELHLHAPSELTLTLPPGRETQRIVLEARLDLPADAADTARRLAHCTLQLQDLDPQVLSASSPRAAFNEPLSAEATKLTVRLGEGDFGPILDRVVITRLLLLMYDDAP